MREVSQSDGRTILFVSHSMQAIKNLCDKALWLNQGKMQSFGEVSNVVNKYLAGTQQANFKQSWDTPEKAPGNDWVRIKSVELIPILENPEAPLDIRAPLTVKFQFWNMKNDILLSAAILLFSLSGDCIFDLPSPTTMSQRGIIEGECTIPGDFLNDGSYYISLSFLKDTSVPLFTFDECLSFELEDYRGNIQWFGKWWGAVRPKFPFQLKQTELATLQQFNQQIL